MKFSVAVEHSSGFFFVRTHSNTHMQGTQHSGPGCSQPEESPFQGYCNWAPQTSRLHSRHTVENGEVLACDKSINYI